MKKMRKMTEPELTNCEKTSVTNKSRLRLILIVLIQPFCAACVIFSPIDSHLAQPPLHKVGD